MPNQLYAMNHLSICSSTLSNVLVKNTTEVKKKKKITFCHATDPPPFDDVILMSRLMVVIDFNKNTPVYGYAMKPIYYYEHCKVINNK